MGKIILKNKKVNNNPKKPIDFDEEMFYATHKARIKKELDILYKYNSYFTMVWLRELRRSYLKEFLIFDRTQAGAIEFLIDE